MFSHSDTIIIPNIADVAIDNTKFKWVFSFTSYKIREIFTPFPKLVNFSCVFYITLGLEIVKDNRYVIYKCNFVFAFLHFKSIIV